MDFIHSTTLNGRVGVSGVTVENNLEEAFGLKRDQLTCVLWGRREWGVESR